MLVRALAADATKDGQNFSFFIGSGFGFLDKYVGGSEKRLKDLFDAAERHQPSIIFFDEFDVLAPVGEFFKMQSEQMRNLMQTHMSANMQYGLRFVGQRVM